MALIPDYAYQWVYIVVCTLLCMKHCAYIKSYSSFDKFRSCSNDGYSQAKWLLIVTCLFFGLRPLSELFTDMSTYAVRYENQYYFSFITEERNEPAWKLVMYICKYYLGLSTQLWFLVVAITAFGLQFAACRKICGNHIYTTFLFLLTSFTCWNNGVNIIRSHVGMAFALFGIALFLENTKQSILKATIVFVIAIFSHVSSALLIACFLCSRYVLKDVKYSVVAYLCCVILSLLLDNVFEIFFSSLGFDDRMTEYVTDVDYTKFSHAGFRWDFLAYSIIPIILGWYIVNKRKIQDKTYAYLLNTYILSNAFWVLVIRAAFSDRFAAISWSLYFLVLSYPLFKIKLWKNQLNKIVYGLWYQMIFLWLMQIYYAFIKI